MKVRIRIAVAMLLAATATASAQTRPAAPSPQPQAAPRTAAAGAASSVAPDNVMQAALVVLQMVDEGKVAQAWQGMSPVARATSTEKQFVDGVAAKRKALGTPVARDWTMVSKHAVASGGNVPAGLYVSARFQTRFSTNRVAEELVSLHLDDDNTWRLAGYTID